MNVPIGLYLHIPFCRSKCPYCDFYSMRGNAAQTNAYAAALCLVMNARNMDERVFRPNIRSAVGTAVLFVWSVLSLSGISTFIYFQF